MGQFTNRDLNEVLLITHNAMDCSEIGELVKTILSDLEKIFQCDKGIFSFADSRCKKLDLEKPIYHDWGEEIEEYIHHYHKVDPVLNAVLSFQPRAYHSAQFISPRDFERSELYNDFCRRHSVHHGIGMVLRAGNTLGLVTVLRPRNADLFSFHDKAKAELIALHLEKILAKIVLLDQTRKRSEIFELLATDSGQRGTLVLNKSFDVVYMNEQAQKIFSFAQQKEIRGEETGNFLLRKLQRCCEEISRLHEHDRDTEHCRQVALSSGSPGDHLLLSVRPITLKNKDQSYVIRLEPENPWSSLDKSLERRGLSHREREVAHLLWDGLKNAEIAERLCISKHTVENHVKSIYKKLGVHDRTSLVHRLLIMMSYPKKREASR